MAGTKYFFFTSLILFLISGCSANPAFKGIVSVSHNEKSGEIAVKTFYNGYAHLKSGKKSLMVYPDSSAVFGPENAYTLQNGKLQVIKNQGIFGHLKDNDVSCRTYFNNVNGDAQFFRLRVPSNLDIRYSRVKIIYYLENEKRTVTAKLDYLFEYLDQKYYGFFIPFNLYWNVSKYDAEVVIGDYRSYYARIMVVEEVKKKIWEKQTVYFGYKKSREILATDYKKFRLEQAEKEKIYRVNTPENFYTNGYDYPLLWRQYLTSSFGLIRTWRFYNGRVFSRTVHDGIDYANDLNTVIYASCDGIVRYAKYAQLYGNMVIIDHGFSVYSEYYHMNKLAVKPGDIVRRGDIIGYMGTTGASTGYHVHWTLRIDGFIVNPESLLNIDKILLP